MVKLFKNVDLYGEGALKDILISNGVIIEIAENIDCKFSGLEVVDANGLIGVPAYIDQHVHVTGGGGEGGFTTKVPELKLTDCIEAGVTTLVGLLGTDATTRSVENLLAKTKALNEYGLTAFCLTGSYEYPSPTITNSVKTDITFIQEIIGVKIALSDHRSSHIRKDEMIKLASEARLGGLISKKPGVVHIHMGRGKNGMNDLFEIMEEEVIPISVFRPTHVGNVYDDAIKFANMGGYIDFTTGTDLEETANQLIKAMGEAPIENITLSSDSNGSMPIWNDKSEMIGIGVGKMDTVHDTTKVLMSKGLSLREAMRFSTENVAKALNIYPAKGMLSEGSDADILLLNADLDIDTVLAKGKVLMSGREVLVKGNFE